VRQVLLLVLLASLLGLAFKAYLHPAFIIDAANLIAGCG
jgi:hypothetical protein